jgi:tRNA dimethylallyltransferase
MALYRGMDIGTAKPTPAERALVPHHLIDVLHPWESGSVAWWLDQAKRCAQAIEARGKRVLIVGGTPLYLKALLCGLFDGPPADETIRRRLIEHAQGKGPGVLHERLAAVDPVSAARIHVNDIRRTVRALEVHELTGKPMSEWQTQWPEFRDQGSGVSDQGAVVWLDFPREQLYERINRRVESMFAAGLIDEVRRLRAMEKPLSPEARQALGYKEIFALLDGKVSQSETIAQVQMRSRNFAKRQITWFRHLPGCLPATMELTRTLWMPKMDR